MRLLAKSLFWSFAAALFVVTVGTLRANADPGYNVDPQAATYAVSNATRICLVIGEYPDVAGVAGVVEGIVAEGLTGGQAGTAIAIAVTAECPQYWPVLNDYIAVYATPTQRHHILGVVA